MKVTRQNIGEEYNITVDWINDFAKSLDKNADFLSNVKSIMKKRKENFYTIDEKMADIKDRVGFRLIKDVNTDRGELKAASIEKVAVGCGSGCECKRCSAGSNVGSNNTSKANDKLDKIIELLKYIKDIAKNEPHLEAPVVLDKCRREKSLGLDNMSINFKKLMKFIDEAVSMNEPVSVGFKYTPEEPVASAESLFGDTADYYQHGIVGAE
jgi:hypothetical protein